MCVRVCADKSAQKGGYNLGRKVGLQSQSQSQCQCQDGKSMAVMDGCAGLPVSPLLSVMVDFSAAYVWAYVWACMCVRRGGQGKGGHEDSPYTTNLTKGWSSQQPFPSLRLLSVRVGVCVWMLAIWQEKGTHIRCGAGMAKIKHGRCVRAITCGKSFGLCC